MNHENSARLPFLANGLSLRLDEISSDDGKDLFSPFRNRIRGWFDRARDAPLSFHISCKSSEDKGLNFIDRIAIMSLIAEDRNWESISLIGIDDASCLSAFRNVENADYRPWKNVKTASIPAPMVTRPEQTSWPFSDDFDVHAPSLRTLSLDATSCMAFPAPPRIVHQHLETLQLTVRARLGTGIPNLIDNLPNLVP
ncbi:hypothetical protein BKA70DRAFT_1472419 [Coprinopsis sp. MPI-PUGE-AT-0042]|nr:hypothetical protein BKA70DRAFT_1472419 [Coprinopsis sp. MPI-PUGE-AT-0042]